MPLKVRTPEEWISFLLTCMDNTPAKPDWNKVAEETGAYKSGKFASQAYVNLRKKYGSASLPNGEASVPLTPKSGKKRSTAAADMPEDDEEDTPKKTRKPKTPKKEPAKKTKAAKKEQSEGEESDEEKVDHVKEESDDELNGDVTVDGEDED